MMPPLADWQSTIFTLSMLGSGILGVTVVFLALALIVTKVIGRLWNSYKGQHEAILKPVVRAFLDTGAHPTQRSPGGRGWAERLMVKAILLEYSEGLIGIQRSRAEAMTESAGIAEQEIRTLTRSWLWWSRAMAAHRLGKLRIARATSALVQALRDRKPDVRLEAAWALGRMGSVEILPLLMESISPFFRTAALRVDDFIFEMGTPALPSLVALCRHAESDIQLLAVHLVAEFKEPATLAVLLPLLDSQDLEIRLAACKAVGTIGDPSGLSALMPYLSDPTWQMRAQTAKQFGRIRFAPAIPGLVRCLEDRAWWVRYNAGEALSCMADPGKAALSQALSSEDRFAREMALQWLDEMEAAA